MPTIDFGIDLGTTNSSIVSCRKGEIRIFQTTDLMNVTPSVVYIGKTGRMLVGKKAYDASHADASNTQAEFKRWMGYADKLTFPASGKSLSAEELSAEVLKALRADVSRTTGEDVDAAVITVPAAFGSLQCEATGRAAKLAGFLEAPLLQEPIAAAIAYGASAIGKSQRWMVFDLGGGTLDIAIVSTRNGRLSVLEHQGNNRLGGKDIDRAIAEHLLLAPLSTQFQLPDREAQPANYDRLFRNLVRLAEQAKIALSTAESVPVDLFNIGDDLSGTAIEASFTLTRADMERQLEPLLAQCIDLANRALAGARLTANDIDRVLLVGGPTQMPSVRAALTSALGAKLDTTLDPMTVVAQGAALYASTMERTTTPRVAAPSAATASSTDPAKKLPAEIPAAIKLQLNHERASGTPKSPIAGSILSGNGLHEIKIDADNGLWSSGWLPLTANRFALEVLLTPGKPVTRYTLSGRTASGSPLTLSPNEFTIAFMLPMSAPPLPHTIAVELASPDGKEHFDEIFKRHTPLPAEARKTYRADRTIRPSELDSSLPIKFWEIEVSEDPQEKWWAGCVHIRADKLKRILMEGTDIELTIKIDKSRKLTVDVFIPQLNQGFSNDVFVPDPPTTRNHLQQQLDLCFERINRAFEAIYAGDREELREQAETLQLKLEFIAQQIVTEQARGNPDPDALLGPTENLRRIRIMISDLEKALETERAQSPFVIQLRAQYNATQSWVDHCGSPANKETLERLHAQMERYIEAGDYRGLKFIQTQLQQLRIDLTWDLREYWDNQYAYWSRPGRRFLNQSEASQLLTKAEAARTRQDFPGFRDAIVKLWGLQPPDEVKKAQDQATQSGLKTT